MSKKYWQHVNLTLSCKLYTYFYKQFLTTCTFWAEPQIRRRFGNKNKNIWFLFCISLNLH